MFKLRLAHTRFLDYLWLFVVLTFLNCVCADCPILSVRGILQVVLTEFIFKYGWLYKEKLYLRLFQDELSKLKQLKPDIIVYASWEFYLQIIAFSFVMQRITAKEMVWEAVSRSNIVKIWVDALVIYLMFDVVYNTVHVCFHYYPKTMYRFHKVHHAVRAEISSFNYYEFSEFEEYGHLAVMYTATMICAAFSPGNFHFLTWQLVRHQGMRNHSANPHSTFMFNPLIDSKFKATIAHNIHHVKADRNFYEFPWHHVLGYQEDVDLYNQIFGTNIRFNALGF